MQILSLDFELLNAQIVSYESLVGNIFMKNFSMQPYEIEGVHRSGRSGSKGFMKIKMKKKIEVNSRFGASGGKAEDENVRIVIRGVDDGSVVIGVLSPNEEVSLVKLKEAISLIGEPKSDFYREKFSLGIILFGGMSNGNLRIRVKMSNSKDEDQREVEVDGKRTKIQILGGKRKCFTCGSQDHIKSACPNKKQVVQTLKDKENNEEEAINTTTNLGNSVATEDSGNNLEKASPPSISPISSLVSKPDYPTPQESASIRDGVRQKRQLLRSPESSNKQNRVRSPKDTRSEDVTISTPIESSPAQSSPNTSFVINGILDLQEMKPAT